MTSRRSLQTILFTDIVGSTDRAVQLGDQAWHEVIVEHHAAVRREIRRFGGREINTTGDGFLAAFPRPALAISCAAAIREALAELDLAIRAGVHMGAVEHHGRDLGGVGVHIGARIAAQAEAGEILVSTAVREAETGSGFEFEDRGERELKGIPGRWRLHAVGTVPAGRGLPWVTRWMPAWLGSSAGAIGTAVALVALSILAALAYLDGGERDAIEPVETATAAPAVAVLPFDVRGEAQSVWREGMVDALSTNLDGVTGLRAVDSRTLLARWREAVPADSSPDVATALGVARRAGARYAVTGSLIETGDGLRIVAEAYDLDTGSSLGQAKVDGAADSILGLIDRLSIEVLRTLGAQSEDLAGVDLARVTTQSLPAFRAYLRGTEHLRASRFEPAAEAFREAVAADSTFALAWVELGEALEWTAPSRTEEALRPALRHVDELPEREALLLRSYPHSRFGTPEGLDLLREATRRYPDYLRAWFRLGDYMYHQGPALLVDPWETRQAFERATRLAPANTPDYGHYYFHRIDLEMRLAPDSARVHRLQDRVDRLTGGSNPVDQTLLVVAFGTDSARAAALRALDTLTTDLWLPFAVYVHLSNPRFFPDKARVLQILRERSLPGYEDEIAAWMYASTLLDQGRVEEAWRATEHPKNTGFDWGGRLYLARVSGLPVPDAVLDAALPPRGEIDPDQETTPGIHGNRTAEVLLPRGAWALERGRREDFDAVVARVRRVAARNWEEADSVAARYADGVALGLEGLRSWNEGDLDAAQERLDEARLLTNGSGGIDPVKKILRWWLGRLELERGREERAARIFLTLAHGEDGVGDPLAMLELARVQERLGRFQEAQANYGLFALAWKDADPALQPLVRDAMKASARLEER